MSQPASSDRVDPLFDTLFRSTALPSNIASAAPVRAAGTRSRAGNTMNRTRSALLDGARRSVETSGTKITMSQLAAAAGVAKATLYNHFRTREAVLSALLDDEVDRIVLAVAGLPLDRALATAATALADNRLLRALARLEPGTVASLGRINPSAAGWLTARDTVRAALREAGVDGAPTALRWLASYVLTPAAADVVARDVEILIAGLPAARVTIEARSA